MGQMPARGEVQPHEGVAGLQQGEEDRLIGLGAGMGLHIGEIAGEELLGTLDGQRLGDIDELAAAVVAPARIALGIFVGQHRTLGLEDGAGDDVLRGDQLDLVLLPMQLLPDGPEDLRIALGEMGGEETGHGTSAGRGRVHRFGSFMVFGVIP
jgi:hypothetical protein